MSTAFSFYKVERILKGLSMHALLEQYCGSQSHVRGGLGGTTVALLQDIQTEVSCHSSRRPNIESFILGRTVQAVEHFL